MGCGSCDGTGSVGDWQCGRGQGKCQTRTGVVHTECMGWGSCDGTCRVEEARVSGG